LQPQSVCYWLGNGSAYPPKHLAKQSPVQMSLSQQQPVVSGVLDQFFSDAEGVSW
jgi:hypothetical protein